MSDCLILKADRRVTSPTLTFEHVGVPFRERTANQSASMMIDVIQEFQFHFPDDEEACGRKTECRICHDQDFVVKMDAPCVSKGTPRKCIQKRCNVICDICHQYPLTLSCALSAPSD